MRGRRRNIGAIIGVALLVTLGRLMLRSFLEPASPTPPPPFSTATIVSTYSPARDAVEAELRLRKLDPVHCIKGEVPRVEVALIIDKDTFPRDDIQRPRRTFEMNPDCGGVAYITVSEDGRFGQVLRYPNASEAPQPQR